MEQYIIISFVSLVIIGLVVITLKNKNKSKNLNNANKLLKNDNNELLYGKEVKSIDWGSMLPVIFDKKPENSKLVKIDSENLIADIDNYMSNIVKVSNSVNAINQISSVASNLVKVDIPLNDLYHISSDKVRFFVQENGKMVQNAIGTPVNLSNVQVANVVNAAMGVGSMVVGQYYMKTITEKMENLENGINKISSFQDEEYKSRVLNVIQSIQEFSDFKYEIMKNDIIRNHKIDELSDIKDECKKLLGQANIHINNAIKPCADYKDYETRTKDLQDWVEFQYILSLALQEIATLEYALYLGKMSRELSINSYEKFMIDTSNINELFIKWHKEQQEKFDVNIDEGKKLQEGLMGWINSTFMNNKYEKIDDNIQNIIKKQMEIYVPIVEDKYDRFRDKATIIKEGNEYYYLLEENTNKDLVRNKDE